MWRVFLVLSVWWLGSAASPACADGKRFALLIGNSAYSKDVGPLKNPRNDVILLAAALSRLGFDVVTVKDATYRTLDVEVRRHALKLKAAGAGAIGFFYYSGHGVANPETSANYLIPVDVTSVADKDVWLYAFEQKAIIDRLGTLAANATHFVVFDACRDELQTGDALTKSLGTQKGFVPIATQPGLLIAYSTAPGRTASDEGRTAGPYATVLAEEIVKPGVEAVSMFRQVQIQVRRKIKQDPWLSFPALPEVFLAGHPPPPDAAAPAVTAPGGMPKTTAALAPMSEAAKAWLVVQHSNNATIIAAFASEFPDSIFAKFARARIHELEVRKLITPDRPAAAVAAASETTVKALQAELKRLNCYAGAVDGDWGPRSKLAMTRLNQHAKTSFDVASAPGPALEILKAIKTTICPSAPAKTAISVAAPSRAPTRPRRSSRSGVCSDGNMDHCRLACQRGRARACRNLKDIPPEKRYSGGTCKTGNMDVCRAACRRGNQRACARLRR